MQFFTILQGKLHPFNIQTIEARASFAQQIIELTLLLLQIVFMERIP